jgi:hypothetical protein
LPHSNHSAAAGDERDARTNFLRSCRS